MQQRSKIAAGLAGLAATAAIAVPLTLSQGGGSVDVFVGSTPTASAPPAGVTLTDPDGGNDPYSFSTMNAWGASFIPIGVFGQFDLGSTQPNGMQRAAGHADVGINVYVNLANGTAGDTVGGTDSEIAEDNGIYVVGNPSQANVTGSGLTTSNVVGWLYADEEDGHTCAQANADWLVEYAWLKTGSAATCTNDPGHGTVSPTYLKNFSNNIRAADSTRGVFMGYTNPWAFDNGCASPCADFARAGDVLGYDVYVLVDPRDPGGVTGAATGHPWAGYLSIQSARAQALLAGSYRPIWPDVETSETDTGFNTSHVNPSDAAISALVWNYFIGGARGITYFNICICDAISKTDFDNVNNTTFWPTRHAGIKALDAAIQSLAVPLNSDFANGYVSVTSGNVNVMAKWVPAEGAMYVFAATKQDASQSVTLHFAGNPTVTASRKGQESGTVSVSGGDLTDTFANGNAVHIYKVPVP